MRARLARFAEQLVPLGEKVAVRLVIFAARHEQACTLEALQAVDEHWSILVAQDIAADLDNQVRSDPKHLSIERGVVQSAQS